MGILLVTALIAFFIVGVNVVLNKGRNLATSPIADSLQYPSGNSNNNSGDIEDGIVILFKVFELEGFGTLPVITEYIHHPVITGMLETLDRRKSLEWVLPDYDIRVIAVGDEFPDSFRHGYTHAVIVNNHAIGFNRK
jgi:hypothetical protein